MDKKARVALLSVVSNTVLTLGKFAAGISMNSVAVVSEALHSGIDLLASLMAFASVRQSAKPADEQHQFGHGKFENIAGAAEALLIVLAAGLIIWHAVRKLMHPEPVGTLGFGAAVMGASALVNLVVSQVLMKTARETDSPALAADAWHLRTDVYTSFGVFLGIGIIHLTGRVIVDPLIGILVALLILKAAFDLIRESMCSLLDVRLPEDEEKVIRQILDRFKNEYVEYHNLRTRRAGGERHVDLHLVLPYDTTLAEGNALVEKIKTAIQDRLPRTHVLISTDPCRVECEACRQECKPPDTPH
ncbi:MAG: cation diffusion facilitator family transporter [Bacillota bacterium]